jgi:hypothetical protein
VTSILSLVSTTVSVMMSPWYHMQMSQILRLRFQIHQRKIQINWIYFWVAVAKLKNKKSKNWRGPWPWTSKTSGHHVCLFIAAWAIFQLTGGCHHYRWNCGKFRCICLPLKAFSNEGSFTCQRLSWYRIPIFKVISERPVVVLSSRYAELERSNNHYLF